MRGNPLDEQVPNIIYNKK